MMGRSQVYRFTEYRFPVKKRVRCDCCGVMLRRSTTFTGTSNPFTQPPYMTYAQMRERVQPAIEAWLKAPVTCAKCRDVDDVVAAEESQARTIAEELVRRWEPLLRKLGSDD